LKSKFLLISCSTRHSKTPPFIINSTNNTSTFKIERKCIIFRELKNDGQSKVIVTQTYFISHHPWWHALHNPWPNSCHSHHLLSNHFHFLYTPIHAHTHPSISSFYL
jgi:hypothetical protein